MYIKEIQITNFRLLRETSLSLEKESTVIVGRNNSGKTSLTEIFRRFFQNETKFKFEDFSLASMSMFNEALKAKLEGEDESEVRELLPSIDLTLKIDYFDNKDNYGALSEFIIDLDENQTEAIIKISYQLTAGKVEALYNGLTKENKDTIYSVLKISLHNLYSTIIYAIDPTNPANIKIINSPSKLFNLLRIDFINAQRGLDDVTQSEKDLLGKILSNIFKSASSHFAQEDMKVKSQEIENSVKKLQDEIDTDLKGKINELIPMLELFGYPGLFDPKISAEPTIDIKTILDANTKIKYEQQNGITLPETYNGLGSRNLIYIMFKLYEFFRDYQANVPSVENHIIFIEEPEAHLHPQMQEVFIRQIAEVANKFSTILNGGKKWPVQFVVTTHSTHIANEAKFDSIRYFYTKENTFNETQIKDLHAEFNSEENREDKEFIHKYLTLTKCDLYFADKVILFEGPTERILMPEFKRKVDERHGTNLSKQYISSIEIGGAYAYHFYKFLDFLELKTLIITDIDSVRNVDGRYCSRPMNLSTHSSNKGIQQWFNNANTYIELSDIKSKKDNDKIINYRRIVFQIPENGDFARGRSFEDAFIIANKSIYELGYKAGIHLENAAFEKAKIYSKSKANYAIEIAVSLTNWKTPKYIEEGLTWLSTNIEKEEDK